MEDYEGALNCYQQALRGNEKVFGKAYPDTLGTIMNRGEQVREYRRFHKGKGDVQAISEWSREDAGEGS